MDNWFNEQPLPDEGTQMQLLVQQTLARKQAQHKHAKPDY